MSKEKHEAIIQATDYADDYVLGLPEQENYAKRFEEKLNELGFAIIKIDNKNQQKGSECLCTYSAKLGSGGTKLTCDGDCL